MHSEPIPEQNPRDLELIRNEAHVAGPLNFPVGRSEDKTRPTIVRNRHGLD